VLRRRLLIGAFATLLGVGGSFSVIASAHASGNFGYQDQSQAGAGTTAPSADKPESKLWYAAGNWWADLWDTISSTHHIFELNRSTEKWVDTGVVLDPRSDTQSDTLWDGSHLYVASHVIASASTKAVSGQPAWLYRYSLSGTTWSLDSGFPTQIENYSVEALTISEDSHDILYSTWTRGAQVYIAATNGRGDAATVTWGTPFVPSVPGTSLTGDDISAVVAYGGNKTMVLWSNQSVAAVYYATHADGASSTTWTGGVAASGPLIADDHINLKTFQSDPSGRVFAAVKTSRNDASPSVATDPLIDLLVFTPGTGTWATYPFSTVADSQTRPIIEIDPADDTLHMFATGPSLAGHVAYMGTIYEKTTSLSHPSFTSGEGTPVIRDASAAAMNNATGTKQTVSAATGLVVLAGNETTLYYWHSDESISGSLPAPTATFTATPTSGNAPLGVQFTDTSSGAPTSWLWTFGDGTTSTAQSPLHTYTSAGTYSVTLKATNGTGSNTSPTQSITVSNAAPVASFTANPTSGGVPLAVQFTDTSSGTPTSWLWTFGDGTTSTVQSPLHNYTAAGTYSVTLKATNGSGSTTSPIQQVTAVNAPAASFTATPTSGNAPLAVQFTDTSTGPPTSWSWSFGDGTTSTAQNPSHTYATAGSYSVTLTATNTGGSNTSPSQSVAVSPAAPAASFTATPTSGNAPLAVQFTDTSTGVPTSWLWTFGDGNTSTAQSPMHSYTVAGSYSVTLKASNGSGSTTTPSQTISVSNAAPVASFTATPTSGVAPLGVQFTDTSTGVPTSWLWTFGDGTTSTVQSPLHTYTSAGTYSVTLKASNGSGSTTTPSQTISVSNAAPVASFTATPTSGSAPLGVQFTDTSTGVPTSWLWTFGDGTTSTAQSPFHTYTSAGTYSVTLKASNGSGSTTTPSQTIGVSSGGSGGSVLYRVDAGGPVITSTPNWTADTSSAPSSFSNATAAGSNTSTTTNVVSLTNPSVPAGTPMSLFQSERFDTTKGADMIWTFPVSAAGTYTVRLYFAETYSGAAKVGGRVFSVYANGVLALNHEDVFAEAGYNVGLVKTISVPVTGTQLTIDFKAITQNPLVQGVEVLSPS
jgi:PKD repeat protein